MTMTDANPNDIVISGNLAARLTALSQHLDMPSAHETLELILRSAEARHIAVPAEPARGDLAARMDALEAENRKRLEYLDRDFRWLAEGVRTAFSSMRSSIDSLQNSTNVTALELRTFRGEFDAFLSGVEAGLGDDPQG
ncbi:hypothetical protein [Azospirillum brasilense]|nr:hypothetical protein [Azospirillum brasilense]